jgi:prepilin-type N-terminal cleavage/methylation domain-containing protein
MRRAGFTLIELLVVIGIIMVLMGLLFPALSMIRRQAQKTKCLTLIHQVDAACDIYRNLNGAYPDTPLAWTQSSKMSTILTDGATPPTPWLVTDTTNLPEAKWSTVADMLLTALRAVDRDHFGSATALVDPWKQPLHYRPVQYYPYKAGAAKKVDQDPPPHPDSYQLWSSGYNEQDDYGEDGTDDVTNWK